MAIRSACKAIILKDSRVLLNQCVSDKGEVYYDFPGGGQNQYETLEQAVIREVMEETGFKIKITRFAALAEEISNNSYIRNTYPDYSHRVLHIFIAELTDTTQYEKTEIDFAQQDSIWVKIEEVSLLNIRPSSIKKDFLNIINSTTPLYLGSVNIE